MPPLLFHPRPPSSPRSSKRRRISPDTWPTSQLLLTPADTRSLLKTAGVPPSLLAQIDLSLLQQEHLQVPKGLTPLEWVLKQLTRLHALPEDFEDQDLPLELLELIPVRTSATIPPVVSYEAQQLSTKELGLSIPVQQNVWTIRISRSTTPAEMAAVMKGYLPVGEQLLFRGMDLQTPGFFGTAVLGGSAEFGQGIYTTTSLELATHLLGAAEGAVYVFRVPDVAGMKVVEVTGREWEKCVGTQGRKYWRTDVVVGAVSTIEGNKKREDRELVQCVWRSGEAYQRLAEMCVAIFFIGA
ncbi:hypothetical protein BZA77DRAFT_148268 [Pyronema omphalodes]|nr:hypothetical protein BZA77DRAFT_148268 [Pyronema omphalodes]